MYVECMVVLIRINNFQDPLVNLRLKPTYDDPSHVGFVNIFTVIVHLILIVCTCVLNYLDWIVYSQTLEKKNSKKFPKFYILGMVIQTFSFLINEQVLYVVTFNSKTNL